MSQKQSIMRGNAYLIIPPTDKAAQIPAGKLLEKFGWTETTIDEQTKEVTELAKHPTWQEVGEHNQSRFGALRTHTSGGLEYLVLELEVSFLKGEVAELLNLQKENEKDFIILTNSEARRWLAGDEGVF